MYLPSHFQEIDPIVLRDAVRGLGPGELVTVGSQGLEASVVPLLIDDGSTLLTGHLARANQQWKRADLSVPVLVIWRGPDAYISPSYYPSKREHGKVVPTWNYISVQARGTLTIHDDPTWVGQLVRSLTEWHEAQFETPWTVDDAPSEFIETQLKAIVGIEIQITSLEGKWKLSQNRPESDIAGVISGLDQRGPLTNEIKVAQAVAAASGVLKPT